MEIEFSGRYEKKTYFKAVSWVLRPTKGKLITRIVLSLLAVVFIAAYLIVLSQQGDASDYEIAKVLRFFISILLLFYYLLQPYIAAHRTATRLWKDPLTMNETKGRVSSQGVFISLFKDWMSWESFVKVQQSADLVVLVTAGNSFIALPRSFFRIDADWNSLVQMVERRVVVAI